jgi:hypothetical protein
MLICFVCIWLMIQDVYVGVHLKIVIVKIGWISFYMPLLFFLPLSSYQSISFCFRWFRFVSFRFVSFRFYFVSHFIGTLPARFITRRGLFYNAGCRILNIIHTRLRHRSSSLNADLFRVRFVSFRFYFVSHFIGTLPARFITSRLNHI